MRISDWSSDVCSSDLSAASLGLLPERNDVAGQALEIGFGQRQRRHPHMRIEFLRVFRIGKDVIGPQPLPGVIELRSRQPTLPLRILIYRYPVLLEVSLGRGGCGSRATPIIRSGF